MNLRPWEIQPQAPRETQTPHSIFARFHIGWRASQTIKSLNLLRLLFPYFPWTLASVFSDWKERFCNFVYMNYLLYFIFFNMVYFIVISCSIYILSLFRGTQSHQCHWATVKCFYPLKIKPSIIIFIKRGSKNYVERPWWTTGHIYSAIGRIRVQKNWWSYS